MLNNFKGKDFINLRDVTPDQFRYLIDLSAQLKAEKMAGEDQWRFKGKNLVAHFEWGSTRTRCSFETSANDLGMGFTYLTNSHFGQAETVKDSIRVFSAMYDAIVIRAQRDESYLYEIAEEADIPVINALSMNDHPTQMLADALTMEEVWGGRNSCKGKRMAYVGNCSCTPMWYGRLCALLGMDFYAVGPDCELYQMHQGFLDDVQAMFDKWAPRNKFVVSSDLSVLKGMDVLTTEWWEFTNPTLGACVPDSDDDYDTWMANAQLLKPYRLAREVMDVVDNPDAICMHMLPSFHNADHALGRKLLAEAKDDEARRLIQDGLEISDEIFEENASVIFREAGNRQHTIKAVIAAVLGI